MDNIFCATLAAAAAADVSKLVHLFVCLFCVRDSFPMVQMFSCADHCMVTDMCYVTDKAQDPWWFDCVQFPSL